ncbi:uncharacterized protein At3g17950 [Typha latifolia]|uniref:uncharacterized protein At3g17950 n=1 Tax=Typha latifolia TaxID=4733 RepID=UPI003C2B69F4
MAQQEGGWPLGLQPLHLRVGQIGNLDFSGTLSSNTIITESPTSSSVSSSDSETESTGSFFHDRSITFGSLIGITSILDLSNTSLRRSRRKQGRPRVKKTQRTTTWFSLCPRTHLSSDMARDTPSLGHFLQEERRASNVHRSARVPTTYELVGLHGDQSTTLEPNPLFSNGLVAPPQVGDVKPESTWVSSGVKNPRGGLVHGNGYRFALVCPCLGGDSSH